MARIPQVTRTCKYTKVTALFANLADETTFTKEITLPRTYKDNKAMLEKAKALANTDTEVVISIKSSEVVQELRSMTEEEYILHSHLVEK